MLLPYEAAVKFSEIERYGMVILVVLIVSGFLTYFMHPFVWTARPFADMGFCFEICFKKLIGFFPIERPKSVQ